MPEWFKSAPQDWLDGYERCPSSDHIALYSVICMRIYQSRGAVPNNPAAFTHFTRKRADKTARLIADLVDLELLISVDGGKLHNRRALTELADREALSETRAKVGSRGGKSSGTRGEVERNTGGTQGDLQLRSRSPAIHDEKLAENRGSEQAIASTRAREEKREEKNPPLPPKGERVGLDGKPIPNFDEPLTPEEEAAATQKRLDRAERDGRDSHGHDTSAVISRIMHVAKMTRPPNDFHLVNGWLAAGVDPEDIVRTAARLAANARQPVRGFLYFDKTIRESHEAKSDGDRAFCARMRETAIRNGMEPAEFDRRLAEMERERLQSQRS